MVTIVGAGIAGLLAANMMAHRSPVVIEAQPTLPNNHSAILRFRSSAVGDVLGIPFKKVTVVKSSLAWKNPVADAMAYAHKCGGISRSDCSLPLQTETVERFIAPSDLIKQMADRLDRLHEGWFRPGEKWIFSGEKVVSTIPMPKLAELLGYKFPSWIRFQWMPGINIGGKIADCDAYVTLYVANPAYDFSRISVTGDQIIVECPGDHRTLPPGDSILGQATEMLGFKWNRLHDVWVKRQDYVKIQPIDEGERRHFIYWAGTEVAKAHSLGRFACWRPSLLADDLVKDVRLIDGWLGSRSPAYDMQRHERERDDNQGRA